MSQINGSFPLGSLQMAGSYPLTDQSIDQQIFAPHSRGPRLGDLSVQTSSYGTQIPRIYGTMRVAGSVIWATDLIESTQTSAANTAVNTGLAETIRPPSPAETVFSPV